MTCIKPDATRLCGRHEPHPAGPRRRSALALLVMLAGIALAIWPARAPAQEGPQPRLPTIPLQAGMHVIQAEVARTQQQQQVGMMFRTQMGTHEGMLFVYEQPARLCFWMRNTLIPLSIAFIADNGGIVHIAEMQPRSEQSHCTTQPVRFALEMNQGWFAKRGIKPGFRLSGAPFGAR